MRDFDPADYGPVFAELLSGDRRRPLDAGVPDAAACDSLDCATLASAFVNGAVVNLDMARCCLAGAWLLHDFLDKSHAISQEVETPSGSFWHGVMHRREGDYSNAKYWFRRVGPHEVYGQLGERIAALCDGGAEQRASQLIAPDGKFDPLALVDACQAALRSGGADEAFCRRIQQVEWELLFDHCYRHAVGE